MFGDKEFDGVGYPTPSSIPVERGCRTATIPADAAWYGIFMGLLETLTHEENWQQFEGGISREDAACYWQEIIDSLYLSAETDDCMDCCPIFRRNPATGITQGSYDGGLTWEDVPDGPYIGGDGPPIAAPPPALGKGSDDADRCFAAWNAADVIAQFYQQTAGEAAAGLYNTILSVNMFLYQLNQSLLKIIYPDEAALAQALGFFNFDWPTYASAPTLDSTAMDELRCLLYENSSVSGGIVSFDQPTILSLVVGVLGTNPGTAVALLIGYMDVAGLNAAGGVQANSTADCDTCGTFTHTFDFTIDAQGWTAFGSPLGSYSSGAWRQTFAVVGGIGYRSFDIHISHASRTLTSVELTYTRSPGTINNSGDVVTGIWANGFTNALRTVTTPTVTASPFLWTGSQVSNQITVQLLCGVRLAAVDPGGTEALTKIVVTGIGSDPF